MHTVKVSEQEFIVYDVKNQSSYLISGDAARVLSAFQGGEILPDVEGLEEILADLRGLGLLEQERSVSAPASGRRKFLKTAAALTVASPWLVESAISPASAMSSTCPNATTPTVLFPANTSAESTNAHGVEPYVWYCGTAWANHPQNDGTTAGTYPIQCNFTETSSPLKVFCSNSPTCCCPDNYWDTSLVCN